MFLYLKKKIKKQKKQKTISNLLKNLGKYEKLHMKNNEILYCRFQIFMV